MSILDILSSIPPKNREVYGYDKTDKPNTHCNWERVLPTVSSDFGWVETDDHFRSRILEEINYETIHK
jgi:hypothetical protein